MHTLRCEAGFSAMKINKLEVNKNYIKDALYITELKMSKKNLRLFFAKIMQPIMGG